MSHATIWATPREILVLRKMRHCWTVNFSFPFIHIRRIGTNTSNMLGICTKYSHMWRISNMYLHLPYLVDIQRLLNIFYVFACAPGKLLCVTSKDLELDGWLRMGLFPPPPPPPLGNFADISYLVENWKSSLLRDVCTLCSGALVCKSL